MRFGDMIDAVLFPLRTLCLVCGALSTGRELCERCEERLESERLQGFLCPLCGHPRAEDHCRFCRGDSPARMRAVWPHAGCARALTHHLKYEAVAQCVPLLAGPMAEKAKELKLRRDTLVTWVTMPENRLRERAIDHGRLLAQDVAQRLGLECRQLLLRKNDGVTQRGLTREQRLNNLNGCFTCQEQLNRPVLLVDDVMTTSATARICTAVLLRAGAVTVDVVTATQA